MCLETRLNNANDYFRTSPIRMLINTSNNCPIDLNVDIITSLIKQEEEVNILKEKIFNPLKIVIMGEVKAGKSTFLNAVIGEEVSPRDVLEATAVILEITYNDDEKAIINFNDGSMQEGKIDEIYQILNKDQTKEGFASRIKNVQVFKNKEKYKHYNIVDTPGLLTITEDNVKKTISYIQWADVIIWVLNSSFLGQTDVMDEIQKIASYGKPIIGVLNRIDESCPDGNVSSLVSYAESEYGGFFQKIFPLSSYKAFEASLKDDKVALMESGLEDIMKYLDEEIIISAENTKDVKLKSIKNSLESLVDKDHIIHESILKELKLAISQYSTISDELKCYSEQIMKAVTSEIEYKVKSYYLEDDSIYIREKMKRLGKVPSKAAINEIENEIMNLKNQDKFISFLVSIEPEIKNIISSKWKDALETLENNLKSRISIHQKENEKKYIELVQAIQIQGNIRTKDMLAVDGKNSGLIDDGIVQGVMYAGGAGVAVAAYAAWLGPAAAYVTLGSALGAFIPPMLIGGVAIAGVKKVLGSMKESERINALLNVQVKEIREQAMDKVINPYIIPNTNKSIDSFVDQCKEEYVSVVFKGWTYTDIKDLENKIDRYVNKLKLSI